MLDVRTREGEREEGSKNERTSEIVYSLQKTERWKWHQLQQQQQKPFLYFKCRMIISRSHFSHENSFSLLAFVRGTAFENAWENLLNSLWNECFLCSSIKKIENEIFPSNRIYNLREAQGKSWKSSVNIYFAIFSIHSQKIIVEIVTRREKRKNYFRCSNFLGLYNYIFNFLLDNDKHLPGWLCCIFVFINNSTDGKIYVYFIVNARTLTKTGENLCFLGFHIPKTLSRNVCENVCHFLRLLLHNLILILTLHLIYLFRSRKFANLL